MHFNSVWIKVTDTCINDFTGILLITVIYIDALKTNLNEHVTVLLHLKVTHLGHTINNVYNMQFIETLAF